MTAADEKASIRARILGLRDAKSAEWRAKASERLAHRFDDIAARLPYGPVAGYWPFGSEADPRPLMQALAKRGFEFCLPVIKHPEIFYRAFSFGDELTDAGWGTFGPLPSAREVRPATLLVPLAAFDGHCNRIGWGKGHYDRSIARLMADGAPLLTIGIAFGFQLVPLAPTQAHDQPLDLVVTDEGIVPA